jgi:guanine nucleotide-binding protein G(i) subunit alpha
MFNEADTLIPSLVQNNTAKILDYRLPASSSALIDPVVTNAVAELWQDPCIPDVMESQNTHPEFYLMDSAA